MPLKSANDAVAYVDTAQMPACGDHGKPVDWYAGAALEGPMRISPCASAIEAIAK